MGRSSSRGASSYSLNGICPALLTITGRFTFGTSHSPYYTGSSFKESHSHSSAQIHLYSSSPSPFQSFLSPHA